MAVSVALANLLGESNVSDFGVRIQCSSPECSTIALSVARYSAGHLYSLFININMIVINTIKGK